MIAGTTALLALLVLMLIITRNYQLKAPELLRSFLKMNHIELSESLFESRLFPVPHLYAPRIELYIDHQVSLQVNGVRLSPDYIALLTGESNQIRTIHIEHALLHVMPLEIRQLGWRPGPPPTKHIKDRVMDEIIKISHIVIRQFLVARRFTLDRFDLFVDELDSLRPLVSVEDFLLKREDNVYIKLQATMAEWLDAEVRITGFLKDASQPRTNDSLSNFSHVALEVQHRYHLEKIGEAYNVSPFPFSGSGRGIVLLHIPLPMERIEGFFETIPESVKIGGHNPFFDMAESDHVKISFPFVTDRDRLKSDALKLKIGSMKWPASLEWDYRLFSIAVRFAADNALPGNVAAVILGSYFDPFIKYLTTSESFIKPDFLYIYPLQKRVEYQGTLTLRSRTPSQESRMGMFALTGFLRGNENFIQSNNLMLRGETTITNMRNFRLDLSKARTISANIDSEIYIGDFYRGARGRANLTTTINCRTGGKIDCKRSDFYFAGSDMQIPVAEAARLYRILSIDVFSYWKSLKKDSEITISKITANGTIEKDILHIEKSLIDSDTGRIQLTGDYSLSEESGNFTLRLMPLGVDRVLEPIPLVGSAIHSSLSFAAQMIYTIRYQNQKFYVEQFTMGTGFERLRKLFRD